MSSEQPFKRLWLGVTWPELLGKIEKAGGIACSAAGKVQKGGCRLD